MPSNGNSKLVLHFDARNTIFVGDKMGRISTEEALSVYMAGQAWCIQSDDSNLAINNCETETNSRLLHGWKVCNELPWIKCIQPGGQSVYRLLEKQIVRIPEDRARLRHVLGKFTQYKEGEPFRKYVEEHLLLLKLSENEINSMPDDARDRLTVMCQNFNCSYDYILPAFFHCLNWLISEEVSHAICIRSYGRDTLHILSAITTFLDGGHPTIKPPKNIPNAYHQLPRLYELKQRGALYSYAPIGPKNSPLTRPCDIYNMWNAETGVIGIQDDFEHWLTHSYHHSCAKPLWVNKQSDSLHIIFDDNIRFDDVSGTNVVNLLWLCGTEQREMTAAEARSLEGVNYVKTDLLSAIRNQRYFIDCINECIRKNKLQKSLCKCSATFSMIRQI